MGIRCRDMINFLTILALLMTGPSHAVADEQTFLCKPTPEDEMGPFYQPDTTRRNRVGSGYLLQGTVKSAIDCNAIPGAKVELWMTGPEGQYGDAWRATLYSADYGTYYFESHPPTDFGNRRPHIHIRVTAKGFKPLITQHYPARGAGEGLLDLVLVPLQP